jgi:restriction system protein
MARKKQITDVPTFDLFFKPVVQALVELGGSGSIEEINSRVYDIAKLSEKVLSVPHGEDGRTEVEYRLAWTRTYLKKYGLLENSSRGIWALTNSDLKPENVKPEQILKQVRAKRGPEEPDNESVQEFESIKTAVEDWKDQLLNQLYQITPAAFERLTQRLLRESGFIQVEVTGKTGDGGIDGKGIVRISGFLSFHVIFQCKRYRGSVTPSLIRDFRGAMQGRADKGLFITTGTFTREAVKEATRDGAPPIDLIDGELLCEKLRELKLGIESEFVEVIRIKQDWFSSL